MEEHQYTPAMISLGHLDPLRHSAGERQGNELYLFMIMLIILGFFVCHYPTDVFPPTFYTSISPYPWHACILPNADNLDY